MVAFTVIPKFLQLAGVQSTPFMDAISGKSQARAGRRAVAGILGGVRVTINNDLKETQKWLRAEQRRYDRALRMAVNRAGSSAKTHGIRVVARETGLRQADIRAATRFNKMFGDKLDASIEMSGGARNLIRFQARQTRAGVSARAWGKRKVYRGTFIANDGHTVFKRKSSKRLPISAVYGPGVARTFGRKDVADEVIKKFNGRFPVEFQRALSHLGSRR